MPQKNKKYVILFSLKASVFSGTLVKRLMCKKFLQTHGVAECPSGDIPVQSHEKMHHNIMDFCSSDLISNYE